MSRASEFMATIPQEKWPLGYLFITEKRNAGRYETHTCEVNFRCDDKQVTFVFRAFDIDIKNRSYSMILFLNEERESIILSSTITFSLFNWAEFKYEKTIMHDFRFIKLKRALIKMLHLLIHHSFIYPSGKAPNDNWYAFLREDSRDLEFFSLYPMSEFIDEFNGMLRKV